MRKMNKNYQGNSKRNNIGGEKGKGTPSPRQRARYSLPKSMIERIVADVGVPLIGKKRMAKILTATGKNLEKILRYCWDPTETQMKRIANHYGWKVKTATSIMMQGKFFPYKLAGACVLNTKTLWIKNDRHMVFWHELGHALIFNEMERFGDFTSLHTSLPIRAAIMNELSATLLGFYLSNLWRDRIGQSSFSSGEDRSKKSIGMLGENQPEISSNDKTPQINEKYSKKMSKWDKKVEDAMSITAIGMDQVERQIRKKAEAKRTIESISGMEYEKVR